jgi:hypothetical protein
MFIELPQCEFPQLGRREKGDGRGADIGKDWDFIVVWKGEFKFR